MQGEAMQDTAMTELRVQWVRAGFVCCRPISVTYAFKKDSSNVRHGTPAERMLAEQQRSRQALANRPHTLFAAGPKQRPDSGMPAAMEEVRFHIVLMSCLTSQMVSLVLCNPWKHAPRSHMHPCNAWGCSSVCSCARPCTVGSMIAEVKKQHDVHAGCACAPTATAADDDERLRGAASCAGWHAAAARAHAPAAPSLLPAAGHARLGAAAGLRAASLGAAARADAHAGIIPRSGPALYRWPPKSLPHAS